MVRILESMLAASLYVCARLVKSPMWPPRHRGTGMLLLPLLDLGIAELNVRYHPTLNLSFAILSPVSSAAADP